MPEIDASRQAQSFTGLSGTLPFDANEVISKLVEAQRRPMNKIEQQQQTLSGQRELIEDVAQKLLAFRDLCLQMQSPARLLPPAAESSMPAAVKASAGEGARPGTFRVEVRQLATSERRLSTPLTAEQAASLPAGKISWQHEGERQEVEVEAGTSLAALGRRINGLRAGVSASVVFDGRCHRLSLRTDATGRDAALLADDDVGLGLAAVDSLAQRPQDALFVIDDVLPMSRPTNLVTDAVEGVTLRLEDVTPQATVAVAVDASAMLERMANFVDGYNAVRQSIDRASRPSPELDRQRLVGDATLRNLVDKLQRVITTAIEGAPADLPSLSSAGITSDREGQLHVDSSRLVALASDRPADLTRLFARDFHTGHHGVAAPLVRLAEQYGSPLTGALSLKTAAMQRQKNASDARLSQMQNSLEQYESSTRQKFTELERNMTMMKSQNEKLQQQIKSMQRRD
jgi:flagellar hook-associated protein 2